MSSRTEGFLGSARSITVDSSQVYSPDLVPSDFDTDWVVIFHLQFNYETTKV
jgi:hypothetical protein